MSSRRNFLKYVVHGVGFTLSAPLLLPTARRVIGTRRFQQPTWSEKVTSAIREGWREGQKDLEYEAARADSDAFKPIHFNGHDYTICPGRGPLTEEDLNQHLAKFYATYPNRQEEQEQRERKWLDHLGLLPKELPHA